MRTRFFALAAAWAALMAPTGPEARGQVTGSATAASPLTGQYQLVAIDGHPIPYAARDPHAPPNAPPPPEVIASTFVIRTDGSFIMAMGYRMTGNGRFRVTPFSGTCTAEGNAFIARWDGAGSTPLTIAGDTLIMNNAGMLFAYRKLR